MRQCKLCHKPIYRGLYCRKHYARLLRHGNANTVLNERHGKAGTPIYRAWQGMKVRCYSKNASNYNRYGGRGIKVCKRWLSSFSNFYKDVGDKPSPNHSLERINNDGDYEPNNVRWASKAEQVRNRRLLKRNATGITGVQFAYNKYTAIITVNYKTIYLGRYEHLEDAISARFTAEAIYWS